MPVIAISKVLQKEEDEPWSWMSQKWFSGLSSNLESEVPHPEESCAQKFVLFCSESVELQMRESIAFFTRA